PACSAPTTCNVSSFLFQHTAPTEIYTLSLHDALPIYRQYNDQTANPQERHPRHRRRPAQRRKGLHDLASGCARYRHRVPARGLRSEEHTSELQSRENLVCRLLLEKKNTEKSLAQPLQR